MSLLDRYGIKEVADVTFYELNDTNPGVPGNPVLYLDTLKVSTVEQTAENTDAKGGKGNTSLISWDYGKEITLNLEDALFSGKSLEVIYGGAATNAIKPMTKSKYLVANKEVPFFIHDGQGWRFNTNAAGKMGLVWNGPSDYTVQVTKDYRGNPRFVALQQEQVGFDCLVSTGIPTYVSPEEINLRLRIEASIMGFDHGAYAEFDEPEYIQDGEEWEIRVSGHIDMDDREIDMLQGSVFVTATYYELKTSKGTLSFVEAGNTYEAEVTLIYNETRYPLTNDIISGFVVKHFQDDIVEGEGGFQEIYISGPQLFEIRSPKFTGTQIDVSAESFPGTYYLTADTYARSETTGKDEFFQLILPKVKLLSESNTITMEAEGDPTVFNMSLKVLKSKDGPMMSLIQYGDVIDTPNEPETPDERESFTRTFEFSGTLNEDGNLGVITDIPADAEITDFILEFYNEEDGEWTNAYVGYTSPYPNNDGYYTFDFFLNPTADNQTGNFRFTVTYLQ